MNNIINIKNLSIDYMTNDKCNKILKGIDLSVCENDFISIIGETGSGKTTLAKSIIGLLPENSVIKNGEIIYESHNLCDPDVFETSKIRGEKISIILQNPFSSLNPLLKIGTQMKDVLQRKYGKMKKEEFYSKASKVLEEVKLFNCKHILKSYPGELSGGMNQRINIALSLILEPEVLICDEITSAIDSSTQEEIIELINEIHQKSKMTIIFITHDISLAMRISNKIAILKKGEIVEFAKKSNERFVFESSYAKLLESNVSYNNKENKMEETENLIEFRNVDKFFKDNYVLRNVSFSLHKNEILGIVGKTGCGKTTICKIICGIYKPNYGLVNIKDNLKIEMVFQNSNNSLDFNRNIRSILNESNMINKIKKFDDDYLNKFIKDFDLPADTLDRYPNQFSGGQKQKIGIIRALLNKPDVIIFDEPTSGLDVYSQKCILDLINKIKDKYSLTYIFISHNPQVIKYMCDRVFEVEQRKNEVLNIEKKRNIFERLVKNCLSIKMS